MFGGVAELDAAHQLSSSFQSKCLVKRVIRVCIQIIAHENHPVAIGIPPLEDASNVHGPVNFRFHPGRLGASDFTHMTSLAVTLGGQPFDHMVYHFVLTYSNWETASICFSESFESLSDGLQHALWELGGVATAAPHRPNERGRKQPLGHERVHQARTSR